MTQKDCKKECAADVKFCAENNSGPLGKCCENEDNKNVPYTCLCVPGYTGEKCERREGTGYSRQGIEGAEVHSIVLAVFLGMVSLLLVTLLALVYYRLTRKGKRMVLVEEAELEDVSDSSASNSSVEIMGHLDEAEEVNMSGMRSTASERRRLIRSRRGRMGRSCSHQGQYKPKNSTRCKMVRATQLMENPPQCARHVSECWTCSMHQLAQQQQLFQQLLSVHHQQLQQQQSHVEGVEASADILGSPGVGLASAFSAYRTNSDVLHAMGVATPMSIFSNSSANTTPTPLIIRSDDAHRTNTDSLSAMGVATQMSILSKSSAGTTPTTPTIKHSDTTQTKI